MSARSKAIVQIELKTLGVCLPMTLEEIRTRESFVEATRRMLLDASEHVPGAPTPRFRRSDVDSLAEAIAKRHWPVRVPVDPPGLITHEEPGAVADFSFVEARPKGLKDGGR